MVATPPYYGQSCWVNQFLKYEINHSIHITACEWASIINATIYTVEGVDNQCTAKSISFCLRSTDNWFPSDLQYLLLDWFSFFLQVFTLRWLGDNDDDRKAYTQGLFYSVINISRRLETLIPLPICGFSYCLIFFNSCASLLSKIFANNRMFYL